MFIVDIKSVQCYTKTSIFCQNGAKMRGKQIYEASQIKKDFTNNILTLILIILNFFQKYEKTTAIAALKRKEEKHNG